MKTHCKLLMTAAVIVMLANGVAVAQETSRPRNPDASEILSLFGANSRQSGSESDRRARNSAADIRQARAAYRANQRMARQEYNLWIVYEPLRPSWNSIPMMSSRYTYQRFYVPVYFRLR